MEDQNIVISFASEESIDDAYLILEQEDYPEADQLTMLDVARLLTSVVSAIPSTSYSSDCIMSDDGSRFSTTVLVYPYPRELVYTIGMVNGIASRSGGGTEIKTETLKFSLDNVASLKYPIQTFINGRWVSDVYDVDGNVVVKPLVIQDGQELRVEENVYGTYEVKYTTWVDKFTVYVSARKNATENFFQSVFYASFDYGVKLLNLEPPPNAEENYINSVDCNGNVIDGGGGSDLDVIDGDDPASVTKAYPVNETITLNYCEDFGNE